MRWVIAVLLLYSFSSFAYLQSTDWDAYLEKKGYVDVQVFIPGIHVRLMYADSANFLHQVVYEGMTKAWLHPDAAKKLQQAEAILQEQFPEYSFLVYDAARPMEVQQKMWAVVRGTSKTYYVANPAKGGGLHNYGMAVDLTLIDAQGKPLPMGSPVDYFGETSHTDAEDSLLEKGAITKEAYDNRRMLRAVMLQAGFRSVTSEWWHFNACSRAFAVKNYPLID